MIKIYTDGCCKKDKRGAWGAVVLNGSATKMIGGFKENTTNNQMEISGALAGLHACSYFPSEILIISDSKYFVDSFNMYLPNWIKKGWRKADGDPVKNIDLWQEAQRLKLQAKIKPKAQWVKGHNECIWNRIADQIASHCFYNQGGININFKSPMDLKLNYIEHIGKLRA
jgi:ribonuclease HI